MHIAVGGGAVFEIFRSLLPPEQKPTSMFGNFRFPMSVIGHVPLKAADRRPRFVVGIVMALLFQICKRKRSNRYEDKGRDAEVRMRELLGDGRWNRAVGGGRAGAGGARGALDRDFPGSDDPRMRELIDRLQAGRPSLGAWGSERGADAEPVDDEDAEELSMRALGRYRSALDAEDDGAGLGGDGGSEDEETVHTRFVPDEAVLRAAAARGRASE